MSYMHITNLYADQRVLMFRELFALEKVHGTSAHVAWKDGSVRLFAGGAKHETFAALFDLPALADLFRKLGHAEVTLFGEAYGGKLQGMRATYGEALRFIAFEAKVGATWLDVPNAEDVAGKLGQEFVPYRRISSTIEEVNGERDRDSEVATRRGCGAGKLREGIVLRPLVELSDNRGNRIVAKHKRDDFRETATPRAVDPTEAKVLADAEAIALEWCTDMRLQHVLDGLTVDGAAPGIERTGDVIKAMVEDVEREAGAEIVASKAARKAIGSAAARLFKAKLQGSLLESR